MRPRRHRGLPSTELQSLDLAGSVIYAVRCHGGLAGFLEQLERPRSFLDLSQDSLVHGGGGLHRHSGWIGTEATAGCGERLTDLLTQELTRDGRGGEGSSPDDAEVATPRTRRYVLRREEVDAVD